MATHFSTLAWIIPMDRGAMVVYPWLGCKQLDKFTSASLITLKPLHGSQQTVEKSETGIPDQLTCLLRNLYTGQEATGRTGHGTTDWLKIGKGVHQLCMLMCVTLLA